MKGEMKHSWEEKLDERGRELVEASAKLHRIALPATMEVALLPP